jgi:hypothetical protein
MKVVHVEDTHGLILTVKITILNLFSKGWDLKDQYFD